MRETKFRARAHGDGRWVYGYYIEQKGASYIHDGNEQLIQVQRKTKGEYTGLKDKNGVEIYEGDVVSIKPHQLDFEVKWIREQCAFRAVEPLTNRFEFIGNRIVEVIGNIYENSDLLEKVS